jgi:hypothetical protein
MKLRNDPITLVETSVGKNISKKKKHKTKPLRKKDKTQLGSNLHNHEKHTHIQRHSNALPSNAIYHNIHTNFSSSSSGSMSHLPMY